MKNLLENLSATQMMIALSVFVLVGSVWLIIVMLIRGKSQAKSAQIQDRLSHQFDIGKTDDSRVMKLWHEGKVNLVRVQGAHPGVRLIRIFDDMRQAFGWTMPLSTLFLGIFGMSAMTFSIVWALSKDSIVAMAVTGSMLVILKGQATRKIKAREALFERQLSEALGLATRSLRAGHPLLSAFQLIIDEADAPICNVFGEIVQQQALGKSLEEAILHTAEASSSSDLKLFAASTVIQIRSGGNVADMMDRLSDVIRDRIRLHGKVRVLTSQTQFSKRILMLIPFGLFAFLYLSKPEYVEPMFSTDAGNKMLFLAAGMLLCGNWMMNKIAILKY